MNTARPITLNCDLGESAAALASGHDDALAARADIINIACGGHAGDDLGVTEFGFFEPRGGGEDPGGDAGVPAVRGETVFPLCYRQSRDRGRPAAFGRGL